jgi:hypothetical protein
MADVEFDEAKQRASVLFGERIKDAKRWTLGETRFGTLQSRRGPSRKGWFVTFHRKPDPGQESDWRTTMGIGVFVDGDSGAAEMLR